MALIPVKCTQCGANISVDNTKEIFFCEYCGTAFITDPRSGSFSDKTEKDSLLARVRRNLIINNDTFQRHGMIFKCHLIEEYDTLQLNFELSKTKLLASKIDKDTDLEIKANVYDASGNLLCIEEVFVEYRQLRRGYAADYFYFSSDSMSEANSMTVYAIDPTEEYDEELSDDDTYKTPKESTPPTTRDIGNSDWKIKERWEDYPAPNYADVHVYCEVEFSENGKTYYYRTRNPELKVGDEVYVPSGYKNQKKTGTIVSMKKYVGYAAPYPLEKTKFILSPVEDKSNS